MDPNSYMLCGHKSQFNNLFKTESCDKPGSPINREFYLPKVQKSLYLAGIFCQVYY
jgi:hypothetical protein